MQIEAKKRGLKGYSKLRKAELYKLLYGETRKVKEAPPPKSRTPPKPKRKRRTQLEILQADAKAYLER
jgi:hypothetical protein